MWAKWTHSIHHTAPQTCFGVLLFVCCMYFPDRSVKLTPSQASCLWSADAVKRLGILRVCLELPCLSYKWSAGSIAWGERDQAESNYHLWDKVSGTCWIIRYLRRPWVWNQCEVISLRLEQSRPACNTPTSALTHPHLCRRRLVMSWISCVWGEKPLQLWTRIAMCVISYPDNVTYRYIAHCLSIQRINK